MHFNAIRDYNRELHYVKKDSTIANSYSKMHCILNSQSVRSVTAGINREHPYFYYMFFRNFTKQRGS